MKTISPPPDSLIQSTIESEWEWVLHDGIHIIDSSYGDGIFNQDGDEYHIFLDLFYFYDIINMPDKKAPTLINFYKLRFTFQYDVSSGEWSGRFSDIEEESTVPVSEYHDEAYVYEVMADWLYDYCASHDELIMELRHPENFHPEIYEILKPRFTKSEVFMAYIRTVWNWVKSLWKRKKK